VLDPSLPALAILCLVFLAAIVAALLLALGFEHRSKLAAMHHEQRKNARRIEQRLSTDRACVLRDVTQGPKEHDADASKDDDFA
jgi:CBS domain containing-hemolysin-like protein